MSRYVLYISIADNIMAKIDATADKIGFIGNHETIVDMNARPVCSPLVIVIQLLVQRVELEVCSIQRSGSLRNTR
jgi:hypothetical protein